MVGIYREAVMLGDGELSYMFLQGAGRTAIATRAPYQNSDLVI